MSLAEQHCSYCNERLEKCTCQREQQPVTGDIKKELILNKHVPCTCNDGFKSRLLADPDCPRCSYGDEIMDAMTEYAAYQPPTPAPAGELYRWVKASEVKLAPGKTAIVRWYHHGEFERIDLMSGHYLYDWANKNNKDLDHIEWLEKVEPQQNQDE